MILSLGTHSLQEFLEIVQGLVAEYVCGLGLVTIFMKSDSRGSRYPGRPLNSNLMIGDVQQELLCILSTTRSGGLVMSSDLQFNLV